MPLSLSLIEPLSAACELVVGVKLVLELVSCCPGKATRLPARPEVRPRP